MKSTDIDASRPQREISGVMTQKNKDFAHINAGNCACTIKSQGLDCRQ